MKAVGVIPARWASTRFPGKPLALIAGVPMLKRVIDGAKKSKLLAEIIVATDDERIAELANSSGARAVMTDSELPTGTDRVWQAVRENPADVIVNIQGDEPLIDGRILDTLVLPFTEDQTLEMATLGRPIDSIEALESENTAKIVVNHRDEALYFSRFPIPYSRETRRPGQSFDAALKHIGIYAYRRDFLSKFCAQPPTLVEKMESLEQLRALYLGARIRVVRVNHESWGVDTPDDVRKIEVILGKIATEGATS